jgi:vancomycin resistance protein YoaR
MAKSRPKPVEEIVPAEEEIEEIDDSSTDSEEGSTWQRAPLWLRATGGVLLLAIFLVGSFELVYAGKVFPGVSADGVYLGGASQTEATKRLKQKTTEFVGRVVTISHDGTNLRIPVSSLAVTYDTARATKQAYEYGRRGSWVTKAREQLRALLGANTEISTYAFSDSRLVPYIGELDEDIVTPVIDAGLSYDSGRPQVTPAEPGTRLDRGRLTQLVADRLAHTSAEPIVAPVYKLAPMLGTAPLTAVTKKLGGYLAGPITLVYSGGVESTIDQKTIISWIQVGARPTRPFTTTHDLADLYPLPPSADVNLAKAAVQKYVADLAGNVDQTPENAGLAMQDGLLNIVRPSRTGIKLDQPATVAGILSSLGRLADDRRVTLRLETTQADVNETNLDTLGIKEQISEGETYFPGSPSTRLTNVRTGAKKFNGVLLKPGATFSFGALLGEVGPHTGYVPELVILQNHEEKQYGGGLCQVSSTAFRAALAAGLPITERHNHSFAISYYTWPYSAPGVDATIYYPAVDFKFVNDTGNYILMQTVMSGVSLKFAFFGTKTKTGVLRGPTFISGDSDHTKPSRTVFYRDVLDLSGAVVKTDKFETRYKSSLDFPITTQFN